MPLKYTPSKAQELAEQHLSTNNHAALFMGCGLGKTAVTLKCLHNLLADGDSKGALIIAPLRVVNLTWPDEVKKWKHSAWMKVANLSTKQGQEAFKKGTAQIYLINYDRLQWLASELLLKCKKLPFDTVVFDELTKAKNHKSKRIKALFPYLQNCTRRWGLTGTPAPNGLLDLFNQIRVLDGGVRLGTNYNAFRNRYFYPTDYMEYNWVPHEHAREVIYKKLEGFALTLSSEDWLNIPDVTFEDHDIELPKEANETYQELKEELLATLENGSTVHAVNAATLVNKLLQVTGGAIYDNYETGSDNKYKKWHTVHSAKLDKTDQIVTKCITHGEPVLVACQYRHELERIKSLFGKTATLFEDAKTEQKQQELLKSWNNKGIPVLVANPVSVGHGLNLQEGCSTVLWYSLPWSKEVYDQFNARVARRGQTQQTLIHRLICKDTIDEVVVQVLRSKQDEERNLLNALKHWKNIL